MTDYSDFRATIYQLIGQLPADKVTTYGDLAALAGRPRASRAVGGISHYGPTELPWHRLVNRFGGLASGFPGGPGVQRQLLAADGISCTNHMVDNFKELRWSPGLSQVAGPVGASAPSSEKSEISSEVGAAPRTATRTSASSISQPLALPSELSSPSSPLRTPNSELPLIVIVGPTASGKTSLAIELAESLQGEIVCADSRTVYKDMDIGTAKPTKTEQARVPHWGLDLVDPGQAFTAADFKAYAKRKIADIRRRGKIPFLVGGTGLYVDAVLFDYQFGHPSEPGQRQQLELMTVGQLQEHCLKNNIELPRNRQNKRHLIRAVEQNGLNRQRNQQPIDNTIIVGISTDRSILRHRIEQRSEQIFKDNIVEEASLLGKKYGWDSQAMTGNIYPILHSYLSGELSWAEVKNKFTTLDWRLAKRQLTWLKRNPYIKWRDLNGARQLILERLAIE